MIALHDVSVTYGARTALAGVTLTVRPGERVALVGPSGAGKSTLLGVLGGLVPVTSGAVDLLGSDPATLGPASLRRLRARIGTVHQDLHLVGPLRVVHNVNAGRLAHWSTARALWSLLRPQGVAEARRALERVGLGDRLADRTDTLSGGQQQRVALARVLVQEPELVLADEPVSSLDPGLAAEVVGLLVATSGTLVASLHDFDLARRYCSRLVGMAGGRVVFDLPAHAVTDGHARDLYGAGRR
ncbi:MAG TPA: phosphonate ABC transporter ATP-binding protein [Mycobacteriales bacterium]|nr:phosphonate ABC transporter ATP-binding protein [Mycobacteriales bacterium]